jgi:hypothetical protein
MLRIRIRGLVSVTSGSGSAVLWKRNRRNCNFLPLCWIRFGARFGSGSNKKWNKKIQKYKLNWEIMLLLT